MDWKATLEEILAERRQQLGERPSTDELIALRAGTLPADDRQRLLEHAAVDREVASELFDILRFPEPSGDQDPEPDDQAVAQRWQALRARLVAEGDLPTISPAAARPARGQPAWLPLAAMFLLGVAATLTASLTVGRFRGPGPGTTADITTGTTADITTDTTTGTTTGTTTEARINLPIVELLPMAQGDAAGVRRGAEVATLATDAGGLVLTLAVPGLAPVSGGAPHTLEIARGDGTTWTVGGLIPGVGGVFVLDLPRGAWSDGLHELQLRDGDGQPVAQFRLRVELHQ